MTHSTQSLSGQSGLTRSLLWIVTALMVLLPCAFVAALVQSVVDPGWIIGELPEAQLTAAPSTARLIVALMACAPVLAAMLWALSETRALFRLYLRGEALSLPCARHIARIGMAMLVSAVLAILCHTAQVLILSLSNAPGARVLMVDISSWQISVALMAGFVTVIGRVMADAARIAEDNRGFV